MYARGWHTDPPDADVAGPQRAALSDKNGPTLPLITGQRVIDLLPDSQGRHRHDPRRLRHRQDGHGADAGQVVGHADRRLHRLRRARQRDDRRAHRVPGAHRPADEAAADAADHPDRQHLQHAGGAREASIYTGITIAGIFPGHGLRRCADGRLDLALGRGAARGLRTARGDARRRGVSRIPGDAARRLLRAGGPGRLPGPGGRNGSVTVVGAVSPPAATSPSRSRRTRSVSWAPSGRWTPARVPAALPVGQLDQELLAVPRAFEDWYCRTFRRLAKLRDKTMFLLQKEVELQEIVQLVGPDALPESEKAILMTTRMIREDFLQQSAYSDVDAFCPLEKQYLDAEGDHGILRQDERGHEPRRPLRQITGMPVRKKSAA